MKRFVVLSMVLTLTFLISVLLAVSGSKLLHASENQDPFSPYQAIMPMHSFDAVLNYPCELHIGITNGIEAGFCQFDAKDGIFGRVMVIQSNHVIERISFVVLPNQLYLGDLILCWNNQAIRIQNNPYSSDKLSMRADWSNLISSSIEPEIDQSPDYFLPITYLSFDHPGLSCRLRE